MSCSCDCHHTPKRSSETVLLQQILDELKKLTTQSASSTASVQRIDQTAVATQSSVQQIQQAVQAVQQNPQAILGLLR